MSDRSSISDIFKTSQYFLVDSFIILSEDGVKSLIVTQLLNTDNLAI